ncbi:MAG: hypothetical protein KKD39_03400 [Candidatus Altiarchaeota archaeon]|nr:hypothetical protein [Candidatus Altiarchaeota archaeon]
MRSRAQTSIELISYIGMLSLAVAAMYSQFYPVWETNRRVSTAEVTVSDVSSTIERVYSCGPGRRETITVNIPSDVEYTQVRDNRVLIRLLMPGGLTTDVVEVVNAPLKGNMPKTEGTHKVSIEYLDSGYIVVGSALNIVPNMVEVNTTAGNVTKFPVYVENNGGDNMPDVRVYSSGVEEYIVEFNETAFRLGPGEIKELVVSVRTPHDMIAQTYSSLVVAESELEYADSKLRVRVFGELCGDALVQEGEECDAKKPFMFPDPDNPGCPNTNEVICDTNQHRYQTRDDFGSCTASCTCEEDAISYVDCSTGCMDSNYCLGCNHCIDSVENCNEDGVDSGPACVGFFCRPGDTLNCGSEGCQGVRTCVETSTGGYGWGECSSYDRQCDGLKCCKCLGNPESPVKTFDSSTATSLRDCPGTMLSCGNPQTCTGGVFGYECSAMGSCSVDLDGSTVPIHPDSTQCEGQTCQNPSYVCSDQTYPCHGVRQGYQCTSGVCSLGQSVADDTACGSIGACNIPQEMILHKMDYGVIPYVEYTSASSLGVGNYYRWPQSCEDYMSSTKFTDDFYTAESGAYAPYRDGTLSFYATAYFFFSHSDAQSIENAHFTSCGCRVRIGSSPSDWEEYSFTCPKRYYAKKTVNLANAPRATSGTVDWDNIRYLEFMMGGSLDNCAVYGQCSGNVGEVDYVTLKLE